MPYTDGDLTAAVNTRFNFGRAEARRAWRDHQIIFAGSDYATQDEDTGTWHFTALAGSEFGQDVVGQDVDSWKVSDLTGSNIQEVVIGWIDEGIEVTP